MAGTLLMGEMEELNEQSGKAKEGEQGAVALVLDLAKAFERVSLPVVWAWATHFSFPRKILRVLCGYFEHQRRVQFEGCVADPLQTIKSILFGSKWSCLLLRIVLQDAWSGSYKILPCVEVDDITALLMVKNREVAEMTKKVTKKLKEEVVEKKKRPQIVSHGKWEGSKEQDDCVMWFFGQRAASMQ